MDTGYGNGAVLQSLSHIQEVTHMKRYFVAYQIMKDSYHLTPSHLHDQSSLCKFLSFPRLSKQGDSDVTVQILSSAPDKKW